MAFFSLATWLPSGTIASLAATVFTIRATLAAHGTPSLPCKRDRASRRHGTGGPAPALRHGSSGAADHLIRGRASRRLGTDDPAPALWRGSSGVIDHLIRGRASRRHGTGDLLPLFGAEVLAPLTIRFAVAPVAVTVPAILLRLLGAEVLAPLTIRFAVSQSASWYGRSCAALWRGCAGAADIDSRSSQSASWYRRSCCGPSARKCWRR